VPLSALFLALAAAALHALWNLLIARARDPEAATAVALIAAAIAFAPVAAVTWDVDADAWPFIVASATLELAYFALLAAAYRRSELGLVYPLARGLAPVFVLVAAAVVLGTDPSFGEVVGVAAITGGVFLVRGIGRSADRRGTLFGVVIAGCIAAYTLVDKEGVQHAAPLPYLELVLAGPALVYAAGLASARGRPAVRAEVGIPAIAAGLAMFGAYAFVLAALDRAAAAPVAAVRETSVVLATVLAARVLHERVTPARLAGSVVVAGGVAVLALT
jgi:drug/metabolite transporter (DMT)-like permease